MPYEPGEPFTKDDIKKSAKHAAEEAATAEGARTRPLPANMGEAVEGRRRAEKKLRRDNDA